ncbi:MAG: hypothetical protein GWN58_60840 [Anaerolineae bacterium]|nr:hypothetical protein [Anaerolineae bacterium]
MRFVADAMVGTLAKWLRILGYDTCFDPDMDDHQLVRLARAEDRVLLTRDRKLARRPGLNAVFVTSQSLEAQIDQVLTELNLEPEHSFSRCPVCNEQLAEVDREAARDRVPAYVARTQKSFRACPACQRVYWRGTHWQQMDEQLARILKGEIPSETYEGANKKTD